MVHMHSCEESEASTVARYLSAWIRRTRQLPPIVRNEILLYKVADFNKLMLAGD